MNITGISENLKKNGEYVKAQKNHKQIVHDNTSISHVALFLLVGLLVIVIIIYLCQRKTNDINPKKNKKKTFSKKIFCLKDRTEYKLYENNIKTDIIEPVFNCSPKKLKSDCQELIVPANTKILLVNIKNDKIIPSTEAIILQEIKVLIPNGYYMYHENNLINEYILGDSDCISNSAAFFVLPHGTKLQINSINLFTQLEQTFHFRVSTTFIQPAGIEISIGNVKATTKSENYDIIVYTINCEEKLDE